MRQFRPGLILPLVAAAMLAACDGEAPVEDVATEGEASGEVLEGTISDAMIPLDDLRSQPPFEEVPRAAPGRTSETVEAGEASDVAPGDDAAAGAAEPQAAPAPPPLPPPSPEPAAPAE